ncbi:C4-dicarboxylate transport transcriptional regulatory protein dctD [Vibrio nigripulchritudo SO65]|nr:C4-dicarboxylate transport transcriptional regulatory protein dctD [Vibrio nigripulchritudo AM115]CCN43686.1 C4-dicarboxylate transport transcriptional regulatory protein dctD [Vibrio nigripulchritudo FTn2]CCN65993.1 C4-dicarboxylate transport transcriptional regulatory protein dctD [Vibrio nigripulchritudo POn4]CCN73064.1 C4-dicarboxylate transport transcriptional regulatory protein dctD [Vibrio nigripulchritudo SFn118]CCN77988.1 C4-dicarboxylate transport transcriptional regulatory protein
MSMCHIYFIDDEEDLRIAMEQAFELADIEATGFPDAESALLAYSEDEPPFVVVTDIRLPGINGQQLLNSIKAKDEDIPVILITGHGDISMAVQSMHDGAYDFIEKPFSNDRLIDTVKRAIERRKLTLENQKLKRALKANKTLGPRIIGETDSIQSLRDTISHIADTNADILLFGETGTGKELVARSLHEQSSRREQNFVAVNCGAVPENLIESELYGHEKGAYTGADSQRIGKFEYAQGGTLFLDEIESMPMQAQIRLLRVLQERQIERIGSNKSISLDIRVIAATKVDLKDAASEGTFRQDLYYRLNVVTLDLPPLRLRKEDIPALFHHFLLVAAARYGKAATSLPSADLQTLIAHDWPGNVRELRNAAERFVLLGKLSQLGETEKPKCQSGLADQVSEFEKALIEQALADHGGSIKDTMSALQLPRKTLYDKMQKFGINKDSYKS